MKGYPKLSLANSKATLKTKLLKSAIPLYNPLDTGRKLTEHRRLEGV